MRQRSPMVQFALQVVITVAGRINQRYIRDFTVPRARRQWRQEDASEFLLTIDNALAVELHGPGPVSAGGPPLHPHLYHHEPSGRLITDADKHAAAAACYNSYLTAVYDSAYTRRVLVRLHTYSQLN